MAKQDKAEVYRAANGEWSWRLKAANGRIICTPGEQFTRRRDAVRSACRVLWGYYRSGDESAAFPLVDGVGICE